MRLEPGNYYSFPVQIMQTQKFDATTNWVTKTGNEREGERERGRAVQKRKNSKLPSTARCTHTTQQEING